MRLPPRMVHVTRRSPMLFLAGLLAAAACGGGGDGITVSNNVASLRFTNLPGNVAVGQTFTINVELLNGDGARITSATNVVTLSATGATITGSTSVAAVGGLATFSGLSFTTAGTNVQLQASSAGKSVTSATFTATEACAPVALSIPGSANGSIPAEGGCVLSGSRAAVFRFNSTGTGGVAIAADASFPARVEVTTEPPGQNVNFINSTGSAVGGEWLLPAGTFQFRISARSGSGTFTVTSTATAGSGGCTLRALVAAGAFAQNLANTDCAFQDGSFFDFFAIFSSQPCTITMASTAFDTYLFALDAVTEGFVAENDDIDANTTNSRITLNACSAGGNPLAVFANSWEAAQSGSYTLTIQFTGAAIVAPSSLPEAPVVDVPSLRAKGVPPQKLRTKN